MGQFEGFFFNHPGNVGMRNAVQLVQFLRILKHHQSQFRSTDSTFLVQDPFPKSLKYLIEARMGRFQHPMSKKIGIDHRVSAFFQHSGHGALAASDSTGQADDVGFFHGMVGELTFFERSIESSSVLVEANGFSIVQNSSGIKALRSIFS